MRELKVIAGLPEYDPEVGAALWRLEDSRRRTLEVLGEMPADYVDRDVEGNSIGTILYHLALIETDWLFEEVLGQPYPEEIQVLLPMDHRDKDGVLTLIRNESLDQHLARLAAIRARLLESFRGMSADEFNRPRELPAYSVSPAWVLHHLSQHDAEHRGELGSIIAILRAGK